MFLAATEQHDCGARRQADTRPLVHDAAAPLAVMFSRKSSQTLVSVVDEVHESHVLLFEPGALHSDLHPFLCMIKNEGLCRNTGPGFSRPSFKFSHFFIVSFNIFIGNIISERVVIAISTPICGVILLISPILHVGV